MTDVRWPLIVIMMLLGSTAEAAKKPKPKPKPQCGPAAQAIKGLKDSYGEIPFAVMSDNEGHQLILFVSPQTWTWTIMQDTHDDKFCLVANGTDFKPAAKQGIGKLGGTHL